MPISHALHIKCYATDVLLVIFASCWLALQTNRFFLALVLGHSLSPTRINVETETGSSTKPSARKYSPRQLFWLSLGAVCVLAVCAFGLWQMSEVSRAISGRSDREFVMDVDFDQFRKIMVRKDSTAAVIGHSGMQLLEQKLQGVTIDASADRRPILNALRGKSESDLSATKRIVVRLEDPALKAEELPLTQRAQVEPKALRVVTTADQPTGNLEAYETTLNAVPQGSQTQVELTVDQIVRVDVPWLFLSVAERRVQQAADDALAEQEQAIRDFVSRYADQAIILPEFGSE
jgi:hypothetical protein